jgi:hypothetical protein
MKALILLLSLLVVSCSSTTPKKVVRQPSLIPILYEGEERYQLTHNWTVRNHKVPKGLVIDGASVPRIVWSFMPPDGLHRAGAAWHDWLYINRGTLPDGFEYDKAYADNEFYNVMVESGVSRTRAGIAYQAVKRFGCKAWGSIESPIILPVTRRFTPISQKKSNHIYAR